MQKLTRREKEIFTLLLDGLVPKEIAGKLKISYDTVVTHQKKLYRKLAIHSIDELIEKYKDKKDEILSSNGNGKQSLNKKISQPKFFIAAGIAAVLLILIGISLTQPKQSDRTAGGAAVSFDPPRIYLDDGTYFTIHSFNEVHLRAIRFVNETDGSRGQHYSSLDRLKLSGIYNGTIENLFPNPGINNFIKFKVSGTVDKEVKNLYLSMDYATKDNDSISICYADHAQNIQIGPGDFSEIFTMFIQSFIDINTLPEGGQYFLNLYSNLYIANTKNKFTLDTGERLPDDMPDLAIWATINNLRIEPLDKLAK